MIYGYYTIPLKKVYADQLPAEIPVEAGAHFEYGIKLAHLLFIPFFPLGKQWFMKKYGSTYEVTSEAEQLFNTLYGEPKTPWYAFSGFILVGLAILYFSVQGFIEERQQKAYDKEVKKQELQEKYRGLENPLVSDYYALKSPAGRYYGAKVDSVNATKVWLRCVANDQGYSYKDKDKTLSKYLLDRDDYFTYAVSKKDLTKSFKEKKNLIKIQGLAAGKALELVDLYNVDLDDKKVNLSVKDADVTNGVEIALSRFVGDISIDSSINLIDKESKKYLLSVIKVASGNNIVNIKNFINTSGHPSVTYALVMYARYGFLASLKDKVPKTKEDLLRGFAFFTKLLGVGLWSVGDNMKQLHTSSVYLVRRNTAKARLSLYSNILREKTNITFNAELVKEEGVWKVNLPSTFTYTKRQIDMVSDIGDGPEIYRAKVRTDLQKQFTIPSFDRGLVY